MSSLVDDLRRQVRMIEPGRVFRLADLRFPEGSEVYVQRTLAAWVKSGKLMRLQPGCYYRGQRTLLGQAEPTPEEIVRDFIGTDDAPTGYITGGIIYVRQGLTTTLPPVIEIGCTTRRPPLQRGRYRVKFVVQPNTITAADIPLFQILDSLRNIARIPDALPVFSVGHLSEIIGELQPSQRRRLIRLVMAYPPGTRALLGAILYKHHGIFSKALHRSLPKGRYYEIGLPPNLLTTRPSWYVK